MRFADRTGQTPHTSLFRRRIEALAGGAPLNDWVVAELNRRGHFGAYGEDAPGAPNAAVTLEELLVLLAMPHAEADGRHLKLIVRALQKGPVDALKLSRLARRERADVVLGWLLRGIPASERTPGIDALTALVTPRDPRPPAIDYDFERLLRRPALREHAWRRPRG